jgi:hypothetical protein
MTAWETYEFEKWPLKSLLNLAAAIDGFSDNNQSRRGSKSACESKEVLATGVDVC